MSKNHISDYEIDAITNAIYNDDNEALYKNISKDLEDDSERQNTLSLAQGQSYYIVPETSLMVRQDGRVFNIKYIRPIKPVWSTKEFFLNVNVKAYKFSEIYKHKGWTFNHQEITNRYKDNKWGLTASRPYKMALKNEYGIEL